MEAFLSLLVFTFPGLVAFFFIQLFGFTPTVRYQGVEIVAASAILWVPINFFVLGAYNLLSVIYRTNPYYAIDFPTVSNFHELNDISTNFYFICYYTLSSIAVGYGIARIISGRLFSITLEKVNSVRRSNDKAPLSRDANVWDTVFSKNNAQVIKIKNMNGDYIIGEIKHISRTYETEKNIVLHNIKFWEKLEQELSGCSFELFIDIKSGMEIAVYDSETCHQLYTQHHKKEERH